MQDASARSSRYQDTERQRSRVIRTYQFGEIVVEPSHIFTFPEGLFGFETFREFVLISEEGTEPLKWLLSIEDPSIGFPVLNPLILDLGYRIPDSLMGEETAVFVIVTLASRNGGMSANMKAPVLLDGQTQKGKQVILSTERYSPEYIIAASYEDTASKEGSYAGTIA